MATTTASQYEIHSIQLACCLKTNKVHQVRKVGVAGHEGYIASFNTLKKAQAFIAQADATRRAIDETQAAIATHDPAQRAERFASVLGHLQRQYGVR